MRELISRINVSEESDLIYYMQLLKILNVFAQVNFQQAEDLGVLSAIQ